MKTTHSVTPVADLRPEPDSTVPDDQVVRDLWLFNQSQRTTWHTKGFATLYKQGNNRRLYSTDRRAVWWGAGWVGQNQSIATGHSTITQSAQGRRLFSTLPA